MSRVPTKFFKNLYGHPSISKYKRKEKNRCEKTQIPPTAGYGFVEETKTLNKHQRKLKKLEEVGLVECGRRYMFNLKVLL